MDPIERSLSESAVRKRAARRGYVLAKSRQQEHLNNHGLYRLVDGWNMCVLGGDFDASLKEISDYLDSHA